MKKFLALLLALVMLLSLAACGEDDDRSSRKDSEPSSGTGSGNGGSLLDNLLGDKDEEDDTENIPTPNPPNSDSEEDDDQDEDNTADEDSAPITLGNYQPTPAQLAYFYWDAVWEYENYVYEMYYSSFGNYWSMMLGFDPEISLKEQIYNEDTGETWQDYFRDAAIEDLHRVYALCDAAENEGHALTDAEREGIAANMSNVELYASYYGYDNVDTYLKALYGDGADKTGYKAYYNKCVLADSYAQAYANTLNFSEAEIREYEKEHDYSDVSDAQMVNVRHVLALFAGSTDADKADAKAKAEQWLQQWKDGAATEESFAELANAVSEDQGGNVTNGGIYEDIYPGQMVQNFENWCFDSSRKPGDTGIVETEYGYHVMYFSSYDKLTYREMVIEEDMRTEALTTWAEALMERLPLTLGNLNALNSVLG